MHPDRLTPEYVQSVTFPTARIGRRGVDESHVRAFCEWVEHEIIRLLNEKTALEQELWRLRERARDAETVEPEDGHVQALYILSRAQQTADKYVANAQEYSREIAEDARRRRDELLSEAKRRVSMILEEAQAGVIIGVAGDVEFDAAEVDLTAPAQAAAAAGLLSAPVPVQRSKQQLPPAERRELETELDSLRTFGDVCRAHLRTYLESLTRTIDEWEQAEEWAAMPGHRMLGL
jgi:cell division septum initiation protein DivIVA